MMHNRGYNYEYWVRSDGVKMLGNYVMVAADLNIRPRGSLVETSLGTGIVCDTGTFIYSNHYQLDIATTW
jgi:3D (Asp-Asp-Asp) domain-containing protein